MNYAAEAVMTDIATVWPVTGTDEYYGQATYGAPYTITCNHLEGGKVTRTQDGGEFMPMATFRTFDDRPNHGDIIAQGDLTAQATPEGVSAYPVKRTVTKTVFMDWRKRFTYMTG